MPSPSSTVMNHEGGRGSAYLSSSPVLLSCFFSTASSFVAPGVIKAHCELFKEYSISEIILHEEPDPPSKPTPITWKY